MRYWRHLAREHVVSDDVCNGRGNHSTFRKEIRGGCMVIFGAYPAMTRFFWVLFFFRRRMKTMNIKIVLCLLVSVVGATSAAELIGYWPLNGDPNDQSGNNHDGIAVNVSWDEGVDGQALKLVSGNQYVEIAPSDFATTNSLTVSFWARVDSWNDNWNTAISFGGEDSGWACKRDGGGGSWRFVHRGNPEISWSTAGPSVDLGQWAHYAVTWNDATHTFRWYKNGLEYSSHDLGAHTMLYDAQWPVMIGACSQGGAHQFLTGSTGQAFIDEVRIYDYALSADEVFELYAKIMPDPVFISGSGRLLLNTGETAKLTVSVKSLSDVSYQWYKDGAMLIDQSAKISGSQSASLTITDVAASDLGTYWCVATNEGGATTSGTMVLDVKRLIGYWPLDTVVGTDPNCYTPDLSGYGNDALLVNGPTLIEGPGQNNNAMMFEATSQTMLMVSNESYFDSLNSDMSVSAWVKTTWSGGDWRPVVTKGGEDNVGWQLRQYWNTGQANFTLRGTASGDELASGYNVNDDSWHLLTGTYDGTTRKIYIDGILRNSVGDSGSIAENDYLLLIGANPWNSYYTGAIDDVRLYNYALTAEEVALQYVAVMGGSVCTSRPEFDFNGDCIVDVQDLAVMVDGWLECGIYPYDACP
jgi:hypothetical protein